MIHPPKQDESHLIPQGNPQRFRFKPKRFNAIRAQEVLTLHKDYFRLRKPIERRVYEIARKHCGRQPTWSINLDLLHKKSGSKSSLKEFRRSLRQLVEGDHLPDYSVSFKGDTDLIVFVNRGSMHKEVMLVEGPRIALSSKAYEDAREVAPGWDIYLLESEWKGWMMDGGLDAPKNPDRAFVGFCRKWFEKRGRPR
ncbi:replication initiator protein A [Yoonia sp. R2-816]|uniref:replication initiator protein A n=1 Tax=Yoonia sp. R2-816 TaxID=3342638 RepID=UPI0037293CB5